MCGISQKLTPRSTWQTAPFRSTMRKLCERDSRNCSQIHSEFPRSGGRARVSSTHSAADLTAPLPRWSLTWRDCSRAEPMREPRFWWRNPGLAAALLAPLAALYGKTAAQRRREGGARAGVPVICVGNFTLGGAGKTPTSIALARMLHDAGENVFCLTRGYGGRLRGPRHVDAHADAAADVGDEALLLARVAPTIVARDRRAGAALARAQGASVIVMDDGLQNASLGKDFTMALVDARRGLGNGQVFPAGPLRAPLRAQLSRCDALLIVGGGDAAASAVAAGGPPRAFGFGGRGSKPMRTPLRISSGRCSRSPALRIRRNSLRALPPPDCT